MRNKKSIWRTHGCRCCYCCLLVNLLCNFFLLILCFTASSINIGWHKMSNILFKYLMCKQSPLRRNVCVLGCYKFESSNICGALVTTSSQVQSFVSIGYCSVAFVWSIEKSDVLNKSFTSLIFSMTKPFWNFFWLD